MKRISTMRLAGIDRLQLLKGFIQSQQFHSLNLNAKRKVSEKSLPVRPEDVFRLSWLEHNEQRPHQPGGCGEEMRSVFQVDAGLINKPEVNLMHQSSCLKTVPGALAQHIAAG